MRRISTIYALLGTVLTVTVSPCFSTETNTHSRESSKYLDAVRTFADNVLKYGRDTYGPKHTPLFVDGLNIHTHEPVRWIDPDGTKWVLSNFNSQQTLLRTLDGLSSLTGDPNYRDAAKETIAYAFENLRSPNELFYWGHVAAYDASADKVRGSGHCLKLDYPHYDLFWTVDPNETVRFIEAYWSAHVRDWRNLNFNRSAQLTGNLKEPWNHTYDEKSPTFYNTGYRGFFVTATSLVHAGTTLYRMSHEEQPLIWSKRLIRRFVDTRHPNTGIGTYLYNTIPPRPPLGDDLKQHFQNPRTMPFPFEPFEEIRGVYYPKEAAIEAHQTVSLFRVGESLGEQGKQFTQWALEELTAWGKASYRKRDNAFVPILTDGTSIEGYVLQRSNSYGPKGAVAKPRFVDLSFLWAYAVGYGATGDAYMWEMTRNIALGNSVGDIGKRPKDSQELETDIHCSDVYGLLGFLELYEATSNPSFLHMAKRIANNIVDNQLHRGFFVPSEKHIYTRFDCFEPLALLHLVAATGRKSEYVPKLWPNCPLFARPYRYKQEGVDRWAIYALTESPELPFSLQEAAASGDIELVHSLLQTGVGIDSWDDPLKRTALQQAAIKGHRDVVELLLNKGAGIEAQEDFPGGTALDYAAEYGHKEVVELLIAKGADIHTKREGYPPGDTPLHSAVRADQIDIVELLITKGATLDAKNDKGGTPLDYAVAGGYTDVAELLIDAGADVNTGNKQVPLLRALLNRDLEMLELLLKKGADVNKKHPRSGFTALHWAAMMDSKGSVELILEAGADVNAKCNTGEMPLDVAAIWGVSTSMAELLVAKGTEVSSLHTAAFVGDLAKVRAFIGEGVEVDKKSGMIKSTALHSAAAAGREEIVEFLINQGADTNAQNGPGQTPLHLAAEKGHLQVVQLLLRSGADKNVKDGRGPGRTPLDLARRAEHEEIVEFLQKQRLVHDVAVTKISGSPTCTQEEAFSIAVTLDNLGDYSESCTIKLVHTTDDREISRQSTKVHSKHWAASEADLTFTGENQGDRFANQLSVGDVNGDGYADLYFGAPFWPGGIATGKGYLYFGGSHMDNVPDVTFTGELVGDCFGTGRLPLQCDINSDGFDDLIVAARFCNKETGRLYIFYGGRNMDGTPDILINPPSSDGIGIRMGRTVACGDINNDGKKDLAVSAGYYDNIRGRTYLYYGPIQSNMQPDKIFEGEGPRHRFAESGASMGDVDGDGYDDLLLATRYYPDIANVGDGRAYLYWGARGTSMDVTADVIFKAEATGDEFGTGCCIFDINGDGYGDVLLGARRWGVDNHGRAYIHWGGPRKIFDLQADLVLTCEDPMSAFGNGLSAGHVNTDECGDILINAFDWYLTDQQSRAYLYYGRPQHSMDETYNCTFTGDGPRFGGFNSRIADFNNDGHGDVVMAGTFYNETQGRGLLWFGPFSTSAEITFNWDTTDASIGKHALKVEILPVSGEQNTEDNIKTITVEVKEPSK